jgi:argininosuccinate lyase
MCRSRDYTRSSLLRVLPISAFALAFAATGAYAQVQRRDEFYWLSEMNKASAVMVVEQAIVPKPLGAQIAKAVAQVIADQGKPGAPRSRDYLQVEQLLIAVGGPDVTRIHSGRSRQDIGSTSRRLFLRDDLLAAANGLNAARDALLAMAAKHPNAIVPAYTWGVQAQPISFGHYVLGYAQALTRNAERLRQAYARLNMSPFGAAALGTSSFPVNRPRLAELLGFDGVVENSLDANQISPIDAGAELVSVAASGALTINTMLADITAQYAQTKPWLMLAEGELTGISSIMPQKRNPTGLVALRTQASRVIGEAQTFMFLAHNVAAGMGDYKVDQPDLVLRDAARMFNSFAALMKTFVFDEARALAEVNADYSTTTELADTLQRVADVPFRVGHHFASDLVNYGRGNNLKPSEIPYAEAQRIYTEAAKLFQMDNARLPLGEAQFRQSLTAENMVQASQGLGGPQPAEVVRMLAAETARLAADRAWLTAAQSKLATASKMLDEAFAGLMKP